MPSGGRTANESSILATTAEAIGQHASRHRPQRASQEEGGGDGGVGRERQVTGDPQVEGTETGEAHRDRGADGDHGHQPGHRPHLPEPDLGVEGMRPSCACASRSDSTTSKCASGVAVACLHAGSSVLACGF